MFLVHRLLSPWWWRHQVPPKHRFLQEPHGVTSQKTPFFIVLVLFSNVKCMPRGYFSWDCPNIIWWTASKCALCFRVRAWSLIGNYVCISCFPSWLLIFLSNYPSLLNNVMRKSNMREFSARYYSLPHLSSPNILRFKYSLQFIYPLR
jgi:hypothetical protein